MRIPTYTSGSAMTSEAPGRSFRTRANAQPFVQQAQGQGAIASAVIGQAAEFTAMRYKAARQTQLSEKLLAGEESLREEVDRLSNIQTGKLGSVFNEGGKEENGLWSQSTKSVREKLLSDVTDRESRRILNDRFGQMELTQRFSLRGQIDNKITAANAAARTETLNRAASAIAGGRDIASISLTLQNVGVDSMQLAELKLGNPDALQRQEYAMLYNGALGAVQNHVFNSPSRTAAVEGLRLAERERDPTFAGAGQYAYAALNMLSPEDRAKILSNVVRTSKFIDAPSIEEQKQEALTQAGIRTFVEQIDVTTARLEAGVDVPLADLQRLQGAGTSFAELAPNRAQAISDSLADLNTFSNLKDDLNEFGSPAAVARTVKNAFEGAYSGDPDSADTRADLRAAEFARKYQKNMIETLKKDPMRWAQNAKAIEVGPISLTQEAFENGETGIAQRASAAKMASGFYGTTVPLFTNQEALAMVAEIEKDGPVGASILANIAGAAGAQSSLVIDQLQKQGLSSELVEAMAHPENPALQQTLKDISTTSLVDFKGRLKNVSGTSDEFNNIERGISDQTRDLFSAYLRGGDVGTQALWFDQIEVATKLAINYTLNGMSSAKAAERAAKKIFLEKNTVFPTSSGTYYIPNRSDASDISSAATNLLSSEDIFKLVPIQIIDTEYDDAVDRALNQAAIASKGVWVTDGEGKGLTLQYSVGDYGDTLLPVFKEDGSEFNLTFDQILSFSAKITESKLESGEFSAEDVGLYNQGRAIAAEARGEVMPPPAEEATSGSDWMSGYADQGAAYRNKTGEGQ